MQEVKNFSSGVLSNGGSIARVQDREARREHEHEIKEAKEAENVIFEEASVKRIRLREERAIEIAKQSRARQAAEEEKQTKATEKFIREEEQRLKGAAAKELARLARQQDLVGRLAENKEKEIAKQAAFEVTALLAKQQKIERQNQKQTQAAVLLDELSKTSDEPKAESPKPVEAKEHEDPEELGESGAEESLLQIKKGAVHVPASIPAIDATVESKTELPAAYDMSALMPAPAVLTVETAPHPEVGVESGKELIDRILAGTEQAPKLQEQAPQSVRSENRFQKIINTNRNLVKENQTLKAKVEKLLDEVHGYQIEGELVESILDTQERVKRKAPARNLLERHLKPDPFNLVNEAKQEIFKYLSTREDEIDHPFKSALFLKYIQDPFYMNMFVQNNQISQWWGTIDSIYNAIDMPPPDWSKAKITQYKERPQPIRARTATLGAPVANSKEPMDRIAQYLGNMGI
jgi:hypothetical protein